jgi:hypothetical protein
MFGMFKELDETKTERQKEIDEQVGRMKRMNELSVTGYRLQKGER